MKKVGIITLNGYFNYGNRLQNYALQETIKSYGFLVETIVIHKIKTVKLKEVSLEGARTYLISIKKWIKNPRYHKRQTLFMNFTRRYIDEVIYENSKDEKSKDEKSVDGNSKDEISKDEIFLELDNNYDFFVCGSDQVWNPYYMEDRKVFFLSFTKNHKKIAYAPSFGVSRIPKKYMNDYKEGLSSFKSLSAREEIGAKIIYKIIGKEASVVIDPTLLLTKKEWIHIAVPSVYKPKGKYLLTYFLGEKSDEMKEYIHMIAKVYRLNIINLADVKERKGYVTGPLEFIDFIKDASILFTDSYHGSIFSILLETPFVVMERKGEKYSMNSRLETLLKTFHLESRRYEQMCKEQLFVGHYEGLDDILEKERKKALDYLYQAFH